MLACSRWFWLAGLLLFAATAAEAGSLGTQERMERVKAALAGDEDALDELRSKSDEYGFYHWVIAASHQRAGELEKADQHYRQAFKRGQMLAGLALAQMYHDQGQHVVSHAWAQVWLLRQFSLEDIHAGKANHNMGMFLLRESLANMSEEQIEQAELLSAEFLRDWLPKEIAPEQVCPGTEGSRCFDWEVIRRRAPVYPTGMASSREPGWVRALMLVNENGRVDHVEVLGSSRRAFERSAVRAMRRWRFTPPEEASDSMLVTQTITFEMR